MRILVVAPDSRRVVRWVLVNNGIGRVSTKDPSDTTSPWVRLAASGGVTLHREGLWLARIDVSAYASAPDTVSALARQAQAVLMAAENEWTPAGWLAWCAEATGIQDLTDPSRTPPMERQVFSVNAYIRPN